MKYYHIVSVCLILTAAVFQGCLRDECTSERTYVRYDPVFIPFSEIKSGLSVEAPRELKKPGKIYSFGNYLLVNELQEGIHVIDNSNPKQPRETAFWKIAGNVDMAVKGHYLYADQYTDLLTIDIQDMYAPKVLSRAEATFPLYGTDPVKGVLVDYKATTVTEKVKCDDARWNQGWFYEGDVILVDGSYIKGETNGLPSSIGIGGSYARFGFAGDYLYTIDNYLLRSWSIADASQPVKTDSLWLGWNPETIFPWKDRLFVGSQTGVFILDNHDPAHPVMESMFNHASGCDPVVCDEQNAWVTIHSGTTCNGTLNQLDVIDLQHLPGANLVKSYPMQEPHGLSVSGNLLFLCDDGLKIFDKSDPANLKELSYLSSIDAHDVIALSDAHLLLIGDNGFFQYDVSDPVHPQELSRIAVNK